MSSGIPSNATFPWALAILVPVSLLSSVAVDTVWRQTLIAFLEIFVPVALLCALFYARLGVERGQALTGGILPGWLFFGVLLFAVERRDGLSWHVAATAPALGLIFLATFAVIRADPPAPSRAGWGWTLAAGILGGLGVGGWTDALGSIGGLGLYVCWSAGWRRALGFALGAAVAAGSIFSSTARWHESSNRSVFALYIVMFAAAALLAAGLRRWRPPQLPPVVETGTPGALPMASAHRMIGVLLFLALTAAVGSGANPERMFDRWEFIAFPLGLVGSLGLTSLFSRAIPPRPQES